MYIYSLFILCIEFYAVSQQAKFCRSCPHHIEQVSGLILRAVVPGKWTAMFSYIPVVEGKFLIDYSHIQSSKVKLDSTD